MTRRFEGKVVVITGGSDGIGLASAQRFAEEGAQLYITARRQEMLDQAIRQIGHGAIGVQGDVTNLADLTKLYERVGRDHGRVDVVFANAGMHQPVPLEALEESHFDATFDLNVKGLVFTVQKALPLMAAGSVIVLNGSIAGSKAYPAQSLYNASKGAPQGLSYGQRQSEQMVNKSLSVAAKYIKFRGFVRLDELEVTGSPLVMFHPRSS